MRKTVIALILATILGCYSCTSMKNVTEWQEAPLYGMVYDGESKPLGGVKILSEENEIAESDVQGRFYIPELARGTHTLIFSCDDHERIEESIDFSDRLQILYIRLRSSDQLIDASLNAFKERDYEESLELSRRALSCAPRKPASIFLAAALSYSRGENEEALAYLARLDFGLQELPYRVLLTADILQYGLNDLAGAIIELERYAATAYDSFIESRLEALRSKGESPDQAGDK